MEKLGVEPDYLPVRNLSMSVGAQSAVVGQQKMRKKILLFLVVAGGFMCFIYVVADVVNMVARMLNGGIGSGGDDGFSGIASTEEDPDADGSELAAAVQEAAKTGNVGFTEADVSKFQHNVNRGNFLMKLAQP